MDQSHAPTPPGRKPALHHVPAILTGAAALIAALTGVYVNLRGDHEAPPATTPAPRAVEASPAAPVAAAAQAVVATPARVRLAVERIAVEHDGSPGTTDWRFTVEADGEPLFAFQQDGLDDAGGRNVANPASASGVLRLANAPVHVVVKGWRGRWFKLGSTPDATGEGMLLPSGGIAPLRVQADPPDAGAFVFFLASERDDAR